MVRDPARRIGWVAGSRRAPELGSSGCRAAQRDRVLTGVKARRCAPPPLRGADGLDTGCAHGLNQSCPTAEKQSFRKEVRN